MRVGLVQAPDYMLAMKTPAARVDETDRGDVELLIKLLGLKSAGEVFDILEKYYEGYANQALWPLFHSFTAKLHFDSANWEAYIEANRRFCSADR